MKHTSAFTDALAIVGLQFIWMIVDGAFVVPAMVVRGGDMMVIGIPLLMVGHAYLLAAATRNAVRVYRKPLERK